MPTVLFVHHTSILGGAENSLVELLSALDRTVWSPVVVLPGGGPLTDALRCRGVPVEFAPMSRLYRTLCPLELASYVSRYARVSSALAALLRRRRPDIVHANGTIAHLWSAATAKRFGAQTVWHVRDLRRCRPVERALLLCTDAIVSVSAAVQESLRLPDRCRVVARVVHNGIDAGRFASAARPGEFRREIGVPADAPLLVYVGQMAPWKGVETLLEAFRLCVKHGRAARLAIVGEDISGVHSDYVSVLKQRAGKPEFGGRVLFPGFRPDAATVLADSDVVVIPSIAEPFGRVALEAMSLGKPVVGTAAGGLPEVVADGATGLLVPPADPYLLAKALERLIDDSALRLALGQAGQTRARERFTSLEHARAVQDLYSRLCRRAVPPAPSLQPPAFF